MLQNGKYGAMGVHQIWVCMGMWHQIIPQPQAREWQLKVSILAIF